MTRDRTILRISQAHVAPGMSLDRWQEIVTRNGLQLTDDPLAWGAVSNEGIAAIVSEIAAAVKEAREK